MTFDDSVIIFNVVFNWKHFNESYINEERIVLYNRVKISYNNINEA